MENIFISMIDFITFYYIVKWILNMFSFIYTNFLRNKKDLVDRYGKNTWAVITGATSGIGYDISIELAKQGFNILLVSRDESKLEKLKYELKEKYLVNATYLKIDFSSIKQTYESYSLIFKDFFDKNNVKLLINNVGTLSSGLMKDISIDKIYESICVNCFPITFLSKILIDKKSNNEKYGIINISSILSEYLKANLNMYSPTKIYGKYFSKGLCLESSNIDIMLVKPSGVYTKMNPKKPDGMFQITVKECVSGIFNDFTFENDTYGNWKHKIRGSLLKLFDEKLKFKYFSGSLIQKVKSK